MDTPMNDLSNHKENLIQSEEKQKQEIFNKCFYEKNEQLTKEFNKFIIKFNISRHILVSILALLILLGSILPAILIQDIKLWIKIVIISVGVIFSLLTLFYFVSKIELIKDLSNKKILIKLKNYLCFTKTNLNLDLENIHFEVMEVANSNNPYYELLIINDYKNLVGIDLDESNIKKKPAKFVYSFSNISLGKNSYRHYAKMLNNFVGSPRNYQNPLFFNIYKYLQKKPVIFHFSSIVSKYMKFYDHFFIYNINNPFGKSVIFIIIFCLTVSLDMIFFPLSINLINNKKMNINILMISIPIFHIIMYTLYKLLKLCFENIDRIDCIYSKDFDRIFIGLVKYTKTKYLKTFEFQMNNINRFIFEKEINGNNTYFYLNVEFKNNEKRQICILKNKNQEELEGLIYLLNERLFNNVDCNWKI